jgi:hypothetical protein
VLVRNVKGKRRENKIVRKRTVLNSGTTDERERVLNEAFVTYSRVFENAVFALQQGAMCVVFAGMGIVAYALATTVFSAEWGGGGSIYTWVNIVGRGDRRGIYF